MRASVLSTPTEWMEVEIKIEERYDEGTYWLCIGRSKHFDMNYHVFLKH